MNKMVERLIRQKYLIGLELVLLLIFVLHVMTERGQLFHWSFIEQIENIAYDARVILSAPETVDDRIVIVDIDEKSLSEIGRWPWSRNQLARLTDQLFDKYEVEIVGFDVVFAEPDTSSGLHILESLGENQFKDVDEYHRRLQVIKPALDYDQLFIDSLKSRAVILGYFFESAQQGEAVIKVGKLPTPLFSDKEFAGKTFDPPSADGYGASLESIFKSANGAGHFNPTLDSDGSVRRVPLFYEYEDNYYESLSLAIIRHIFNSKTVEPVYGFNFYLSDYNAPDYFKVGNRKIPVDEHSNVLVPYRGREGSFPYISAVDVINGVVEKSMLHDSVVLVGSSAKGLFDLRNTPVQSALPGVEVHANLISGIYDKRIKEKPFYVLGGEIMILIILGVVMIFVINSLSPIAATLSTMGLILFVLCLNAFAWTQMNLVIPLAASLIMLLSMFLLAMSYGFFVTKRGERQITGLFGQYIPPELVEEMSNNPSRYTLEAEVRELTVLFSDIRSFTTISEAMDAKDLSDLLNEYLTPMTHVIQHHRGTIDKYIGDAIMAFWGAPLDHPSHAKSAIDASFEMLAVLKTMNREFLKRGWPELKIGIGLNTGPMRVGDMGSEFRKAYTVMGDAVNLGSRLEGMTKQYGVELLVSEYTKQAAPEYAYRELDKIRVKGKDEPVIIYEPLCLKADVTPALKDEIKLYRQAVAYYREQNWDMAEVQFINLMNNQNSPKLYQAYIERIQELRANPPSADWDGVYRFTTK